MNERELTILIVDDTHENIDLLNAVLRDTYRIKVALSGKMALKILNENPNVDMILLDIMMPEMDGYEVCKKLKQNPLLENIPVIFVTSLNDYEDERKGLDLGAVDYITKPINPAITKARIKTHLALYNQNRELERKVKLRTQELEKSRQSIIRQLGRAAEFKDNETGMHVIRMSHYTRLIAESIVDGINEWSDMIFQASPMHDVGKIGIPDHILLKPGKLDEEEWKTMKKHPEFGTEILGMDESKLLHMAKEISLYHHEKYDGSGYPFGLSGDDIPLSGRIVAITDVFDALTSDRPYKKAWSVDKAVAFIDENSGKHFDPEVVKHFHKVLPEIILIKDKFTDEFFKV